MFFENIEQIKIRIKNMAEEIRELRMENEVLREKLQRQEDALKKKEFELQESGKKMCDYLALERENKQFRLNKEILQESIDQLIEELESL
jgi:regulator of replication initiation timing